MAATKPCCYHITFLVHGKETVQHDKSILDIHICIYNHDQVVKSQLTGPDFVWLLPGWYTPGWWSDVSDTDCTVAEMKDGLEHSLTYASNSIVDTNLSRVIVSGKVPDYCNGVFIIVVMFAVLECFTVSK